MQQLKFAWPNTQQGMSKWAWLFFIATLVLLGTAALRLGPHYIDYRVVQSVTDRLPVDQVHSDWTRAEIREHYQKQFRIESFSTPVKDILKVTRSREQTTVDINYEVREHLFYNIDVVLVFSDQRIFE